MTREELIRELQKLPLAEREALVADVTHGIREELQANGSLAKSADQTKRIEVKLAAVNRLRGAFRMEKTVPTDDELKEEYIDYLMKKYS